MTVPDSPLEAALRRLLVPSSGMTVVAVGGASGYRIGRASDSALVLLTPPDPEPSAPTRLRRLSLAPRQHVRITSTDGAEQELDAGVVAFLPGDDDLLPHFVRVAEALVELLGPAPAPTEVSKAMQRLVALFEPPAGVRGSVLGLWGELFVISRAADPVRMARAWHVSVDDRFDFAEQGSRLEVKTTTASARVHRFRLQQLEPVPGVETHVVSITTAELGAGASVADLVGAISHALTGHPLLQLKVQEQVARTLGPDWGGLPHRFDLEQAAADVRVLEATAIPRVATPPPEVLQVELTVDCSTVPPAVPSSPRGLADLVASTTV